MSNFYRFPSFGPLTPTGGEPEDIAAAEARALAYTPPEEEDRNGELDLAWIPEGMRTQPTSEAGKRRMYR